MKHNLYQLWYCNNIHTKVKKKSTRLNVFLALMLDPASMMPLAPELWLVLPPDALLLESELRPGGKNLLQSSIKNAIEVLVDSGVNSVEHFHYQHKLYPKPLGNLGIRAFTTLERGRRMNGFLSCGLINEKNSHTQI